jgi:hypothetical protein
VYPALQVQAVDAVHPTHEEQLFSGHAVHHGSKLELLYVAAAHAVQAFPVGHIVFVMSTPWYISSVIALVASVPRYSSTTKKPATSAFIMRVGSNIDFPKYIEDSVLSAKPFIT